MRDTMPRAKAIGNNYGINELTENNVIIQAERVWNSKRRWKRCIWSAAWNV